MDSQLVSLSKIFTEKILRIPDYQRGYAWTEKQLKEFWNDLLQLDEGKNHYTGVLTLESVPESDATNWTDDAWIIQFKGYTPYYIVDGQQRLTTSIILIQSISEYIPNDKKLNFTSIEKIREKFIFENKDESISRSYIFGYAKDNPSDEFLKTKIFLEKSDKASNNQETIYTSNLENAKKFFSQRLNELKFEEVEFLYRKLTQNFLFNIYSISEEIDVFVAFETMNNRGKPLSHLELLKNRLIYISTKFKTGNHEKTKLRKSINESWKAIYHQLGRNKNNPLSDDEFLTTHFLIYHEKAMKDYEEYKDKGIRTPNDYLRRSGRNYQDYLLEEKFTPKNVDNNNLSLQEVYAYVTSLKESVEIWYQLLNPADSDFSDEEKVYIEKLNRLDIKKVAPIIMVFYQKEKNIINRIRILKLLERYLFIDTFVKNLGYHVSTDNQIMHFLDQEDLFAVSGSKERFLSRDTLLSLAFQLNKGTIDNEKVIKNIDTAVNTLWIDNFVRHMIRQFGRGGFYSWEGIKYFLYEYERELKNRGKNHTQKLNWQEFCNTDKRDFLTVEHIYPQNARKDCWKENFNKYALEERKLLMNSIGNLLPLSKPKNSSFQNSCFEDKKGNLEKKIGFKYGSYSEIEVSNYENWTAKEILIRGLDLLNFLESNWAISLGTIEEKVELLRLEFVLFREKINSSELEKNKKSKTKDRKVAKSAKHF